MAFPTTGLLDNFNRANAATLGANWTTAQIAGTKTVGILSNQAHIDEAESYVLVFYNVGTYGPNSETTLDVPTKITTAGDSVDVIARATTMVLATVDGYDLSVATSAGTDTFGIYRIDNGVTTLIGATVSQELSDGESVGIEIIGSTIKGYRKSGGTWAEVVSRTDATYSAAGYCGFYGSGLTGWRYDNFGGGTVVATSTQPPRTMHQARMRRT